jgi:hypothetical protein
MIHFSKYSALTNIFRRESNVGIYYIGLTEKSVDTIIGTNTNSS